MTNQNENTLAGKYFHSIDVDDGTINWQGRVVCSPESGMWLVQLHSWLDGQETFMKLVKTEDIE